MTEYEVIPDPVDLPIGSRPAWRALVRIVNSLRGQADRTAREVQTVTQQTAGQYTAIASTATTVESQGEAIVEFENTTELAQEAKQLANSATQSANNAAEQAAIAQAIAEGAGNDIDGMGTYYRFTEDGALIGREGSRYVLSLQNDGIEFLENNQVVSLWDAGRMIVKSFIGDEVILANHKMEARGDRTIMRSL